VQGELVVRVERAAVGLAVVDQCFLVGDLDSLRLHAQEGSLNRRRVRGWC